MLSYVFTFLYGLVLLCSFVGWGGVVARLAGRSATGLALRAAWGMALCIAIGGVLNLLGLAFGVVLIGLTLAGFVAIFVVGHSARNAGTHLDSSARPILLAIGIILAVRYAAAVSSENYNAQDDYQGYFTFPQKLIQTGRIGADPFSERRIISSLGGQYLLDAMLISAVSEAHLNLLDHGIALLVLAGLAWELARENGVTRQSAACLLLLIALSVSPQPNVSSLYVAAAACVALFQTLELIRQQSTGAWRDGILVGLVAAGAATLKMNVIPAVGLLVALHFLGRCGTNRRGRAETLAIAVVSAFAAIAFLSPWMIDSLRCNGTLLYPLMGHGFYGSNYGDFKLPNSGMNLASIVHYLGTAFAGALPILLLISVVCSLIRRQIARSEYLFGAAALIGTIIVAISIGGFGTFRFTFAFNFAAMIVILCCWMKQPAWTGAAMLAIGLLIGENWPTIRLDLRHDASGLVHQIKGATAADQWQPAQYAAAQDSVPAGQTILERLDTPFLLNYRRNPIYAADVPGRASLPPGMPSFAGPESLAGYLTNQDIRYVAYSYRDDAGFSLTAMGARLAPTELEWIRNTAEYVFDFQYNLRLLGQTRKRVYDDGSIWVIDLATRAGSGR